MFKKFDFEQIHPSKKAAFTDGALTATVIVSTMAWMWTERQTAKAWLEGWVACDKSHDPDAYSQE